MPLILFVCPPPGINDLYLLCLGCHELSWGRSLGCWGLEPGGVRAAAGLGGKEGALTTSLGDYTLKWMYPCVVAMVILKFGSALQ